MNYTEIIDAIVSRLNPLVGMGFEVMRLSEIDDDNVPPYDMGRVVVSLRDSTFHGLDGSSTNVSNTTISGSRHDEELNFGLYIHSRLLYGPLGVYEVRAQVQRLLLGWRYKTTPFYFKDFQYVAHEGNVWTYGLTVSTMVKVFGGFEDEVIGGKLFSITSDLGSEVVIFGENVRNIGVWKYLVGEPIDLKFDFSSADGTPVDVSGYAVRFGIKGAIDDASTLILLESLVPDVNRVRVQIAAVDNILVEGQYYGILELLNPESSVEHEFSTRILILPQNLTNA